MAIKYQLDLGWGFELNGKFYQTDGYGYLVNFKDWNKEVAEHLAKEEGINMIDAHWVVVNFIREYYEEYKMCPSLYILVKTIVKKLGPEKGNEKYLYELFPGPAFWGNQVCKIAGFSGPTDYGFVLKGKNYQTDWNGYLLNFEDWSIGVAEHLAKEEGINMTDAHWEIINFLREYYEEYNIAPMIKILVKAIGKKLGLEKGNKEYLYKLFPKGAMQAIKIAGIPRPHGDP